MKNVLPVGLLAVVAFVGFFAFALVAMLAILLLPAIGGLVHPVLAALLAAPVYFGALLVLYVVMFGVMYFMWPDGCGDCEGSPPLPPARVGPLPFPAQNTSDHTPSATTRPPRR